VVNNITDLRQQLVLRIKRIPIAGSCEPVQSHHCMCLLYMM